MDNRALYFVGISLVIISRTLFILRDECILTFLVYSNSDVAYLAQLKLHPMDIGVRPSVSH